MVRVKVVLLNAFGICFVFKEFGLMNRFLFSLCFISFVANGYAQAESSPYKEGYFFCDFLGIVITKYNQPDKYPNKHFNRVFYYKKQSDGSFEQNFDFGGAEEAQLRGDVLSNAFLDYEGEREGFYRQLFHVYRINLSTGVLIHSYVYYLHPEDYEKHFKKYNRPGRQIREHKYLLGLLQTPVPKGYIKAGYDKSQWQCSSVSYSRYLWLSFTSIFKAILSV